MHQQNMAVVSGLDIDNTVSMVCTLFDSHTPHPLHLILSMPKRHLLACHSTKT